MTSFPQDHRKTQNAATHLEVRVGTAEDLDAIKDIVREAYSPYTAQIGRVPGPMLADYGVLIASRRVSVVEIDGVIKGLLVLIPEPHAMLLDNVAIAPSAQGLGLGRKMLELAEQRAKEAGYHTIKLYTNEAMVKNIELYSRLGYSETHRVEEKGLKRVYMAKTLT